MEIAITRADLSDLPALAEISRLAYLRETITQSAFTDWASETNMCKFLTLRLRGRFSTSDAGTVQGH